MLMNDTLCFSDVRYHVSIRQSLIKTKWTTPSVAATSFLLVFNWNHQQININITRTQELSAPVIIKLKCTPSFPLLYGWNLFFKRLFFYSYENYGRDLCSEKIIMLKSFRFIKCWLLCRGSLSGTDFYRANINQRTKITFCLPDLETFPWRCLIANMIFSTILMVQNNEST